MPPMPPNANRKNDAYTKTLDDLVLRRHSEGFNIHQIAARVGIGVTAVRSALARSRERTALAEEKLQPGAE